eukprot:scaffold976_cov214-Ochromonas_danica.AAC.6
MSASSSSSSSSSDHSLPSPSTIPNTSSSSSSSSTVVVPKFAPEDFNRHLHLVALIIPARLSTDYLKTFSEVLFDRPRCKRIFPLEGQPEKRLLLLKESVLHYDDLPETLRLYHESSSSSNHQNETEVVVAGGEGEGRFTTYEMILGYDHFSVEEILSTLLSPAHGVTKVLTEIPSSYEQAGHIAHVNLREEALPYKHLIGEVILAKNKKQIRCVVNKIASIDTVYRTFPLEVIAGENDLNVILKESGAKFMFNFAEVYWNSRLQAEHHRLINLIRQRATTTTTTTTSTVTTTNNGSYVIADMMAGVGPFAVPLAMQQAIQPPMNHSGGGGDGGHKKKDNNKKAAQQQKSNTSTNPIKPKMIKVYANDLNPASFKYLSINAESNHCQKWLKPFNLDGREFVVSEVVQKEKTIFHEAILNLPQSATTFLDTFIGLAYRYRRVGLLSEDSPAETVQAIMPIIHVYAFSTADGNEKCIEDIIQRAADVLTCPHGSQDLLEMDICEGHIVRDVAPKKVMVCLSFRLPRIVAELEPPSFSFESKKRSLAAMEQDTTTSSSL